VIDDDRRIMNSNLNLIPDGYQFAAGNNSITSNWMDKRSATSVSLSFVFSGVNAPTGTLTVETSNAPEKVGGGVGQPGPTLDVSTFTGSSISVTAVGVNKWEITTSARWVRVKYVASANVAGLFGWCWANAPYVSPG